MFRKLLPSLLAVVIAFGAIAFKEIPKANTTGNWFIYNGTGADQDLASSYSLEGDTHTECENANSLCAIFIATNTSGVLTNQEVQDLIDEEWDETGHETFNGQSSDVDYKQ